MGAYRPRSITVKREVNYSVGVTGTKRHTRGAEYPHAVLPIIRPSMISPAGHVRGNRPIPPTLLSPTSQLMSVAWISADAAADKGEMLASAKEGSASFASFTTRESVYRSSRHCLLWVHASTLSADIIF